MVNVTYSMFFDRPQVQKRVKEGTKSPLSKAGSFVRQRAKSSIRKRRRTADPGNPPSSHIGLLKKLIFFGYDAATDSVVVGPKLTRNTTPTVPELLEFGGTTRHWRTGEPAVYREFAFMRPALDAERENFPNLFTDCVK